MNNKYLPEGSLIATPENKAAMSDINSLEESILSHRILEVNVCQYDGQKK